MESELTEVVELKRMESELTEVVELRRMESELTEVVELRRMESELTEVVESLPSDAVNHLFSLGLCVRCVFRVLGVQATAVYASPSLWPSIFPLQQPTDKLCTLCLGILQFTFRDDQTNTKTDDIPLLISDLVKRQGYHCDSFSLQVSIPQIIHHNDNSLRSYMKTKYGSQPWFQHTCISAKDAFKFSILHPLENLLECKSSMDSLRICLTYSASKEPDKCSDNVDTCKRRKTDENNLVGQKPPFVRNPIKPQAPLLSTFTCPNLHPNPNSPSFIAYGISPSFTDSLHKASVKAVDILTAMAVPVELSDRESLVKSASISLNSKVVSQYSSLLAPIAVDSVLSVVDSDKPNMVDLRDVKIVNKLGGTVDDTELVKGLVFDKKVSHAAGGPTRMENAKIAVTSSSLFLMIIILICYYYIF